MCQYPAPHPINRKNETVKQVKNFKRDQFDETYVDNYINTYEKHENKTNTFSKRLKQQNT